MCDRAASLSSCCILFNNKIGFTSFYAAASVCHSQWLSITGCVVINIIVAITCFSTVLTSVKVQYCYISIAIESEVTVRVLKYMYIHTLYKHDYPFKWARGKLLNYMDLIPYHIFNVMGCRQKWDYLLVGPSWTAEIKDQQITEEQRRGGGGINKQLLRPRMTNKIPRINNCRDKGSANNCKRQGSKTAVKRIG